jgi:hypothetical protein
MVIRTFYTGYTIIYRILHVMTNETNFSDICFDWLEKQSILYMQLYEVKHLEFPDNYYGY